MQSSNNDSAGIPKIIHYCWFGRAKKPKIIKMCIKSWKKLCPDYKIIEWNESNFDVNCIPFCEQAYNAKQWAFVSDYARLKVLYEYGGIYMDTDVELVKPLTPFLTYRCFLGFQHEHYVSNGLVTGAVPKHPFIAENLAIYEHNSFTNEADSSKLVVCQEYTTNILSDHGLRLPCDGTVQVLEDIVVFPPEYFCPYDHRNFTMNKTEKTVSVHHFTSSWWDSDRKHQYKKIKRQNVIHYYLHTPNRILQKLLGMERYEKFKKTIKRR